MSQDYALHLAQQFLARMGSGAEPTEIAKLFSENMEWEIAAILALCPGSGKNPAGSQLSILQ